MGKNKPKINEDPKDAKLREYQEQIAKLRQQLLEKSGKVPRNKTRSKKKNRRIKVDPETGEEYSEYETDSEEDDNYADQENEDPEEIAEMKKQLQEEKARLENNHNLVKSER